MLNNKPFPAGTKLCAYLRDSGGDDQDLSITQQEIAINSWCRENGYVLTHIYVDEAKSGSSVNNRNGFQALIQHFRDPECQEAGIIIWKYSRFAREIDDAAFYKSDLRRRGYVLYSINESIPDSLDGRLFESLISWKDQKYLDDLSADIKRGLHHLVKHYGAVPGRAPTGFRREPINLGMRRDGTPHIAYRITPDEDRISIIRLAFEMRAAGATLKHIHQETGIPISVCLSTLFANRIYIGELHYGDLVIPNYCEPIIDQELWDRVQARRNMNHHPRRISSSFVLSGLAYCAHCGSLLNGNVIRSSRLKNSHSYYACQRKRYQGDCIAEQIPQGALEKAVLSEMRAHILTPDILEQLQDELRTRYQELEAEAKSGRRIYASELTTLRRKITNITDAIAKTGYSRNLITTLSELEAQEGELIAEIERLDSLVRPQEALEYSAGELAAKLNATLDTAEAGQLREIYRNIIERIDVKREGKYIRGIIYYHAPYVYGDYSLSVNTYKHNLNYQYTRGDYRVTRE